MFERLGSELARFRDERGRELFDLKDAPRPPADAPAPVRLLPEFDSLMLAHADRTRVIADEHRKSLTTKNLRVRATVLVDGRVAAYWKLEKSRGTGHGRGRAARPAARGGPQGDPGRGRGARRVRGADRQGARRARR